jgi:hypothetical protein
MAGIVSIYAESSRFCRSGAKACITPPYWIAPRVDHAPIEGAGKSIEEIPMMHKFQVGQSVALIPRVIRQAATGTYEITRLMPENEVEPHYRIKSDAERHERVVPESELETSLTS